MQIFTRNETNVLFSAVQKKLGEHLTGCVTLADVSAEHSTVMLNFLCIYIHVCTRYARVLFSIPNYRYPFVGQTTRQLLFVYTYAGILVHSWLGNYERRYPSIDFHYWCFFLSYNHFEYTWTAVYDGV